MATPRPHFRELTREESLALLARNQVGRLAFAHRDRIDIEPLHYRLADGWLYGRTTPGARPTELMWTTQPMTCPVGMWARMASPGSTLASRRPRQGPSR